MPRLRFCQLMRGGEPCGERLDDSESIYCILMHDDDSPTNDWLEAERLFPGCGEQWDAQHGDKWVGASQPVMIINEKLLAIGCDRAPRARWALWNQEKGAWIFVGGTIDFTELTKGIDPRLQVDRRR